MPSRLLRTLASAALTLSVALVAGLLPLVRELRGDLARGIADGNRRAAGSRRDHRTRAWLVGAECALAVVLLACGALLLSGFNRAAQVNPGFDPRSVLGAQLRRQEAPGVAARVRRHLLRRAGDQQLAAARASRDRYQAALSGAGYGEITTQIALADDAGDGTFYYAEDYHQGYLHKHPGGYCNHGFCQIGYDLAAHGQGAAQAVLPES